MREVKRIKRATGWSINHSSKQEQRVTCESAGFLGLVLSIVNDFFFFLILK